MSDAALSPIRRLPVVEFTAMLAALFATLAFSIDAMLPALPQIGAELSPDALNRAQLVLSAFVLGMGVGTFFVGPISDATGRKVAIAGGFALYVVASAIAHYAQNLEILLVARVIQGIGASAPRVAGVAMLRDLYAGREMARIMSFVMMVFMVVPALAPLVGQTIILFFDWRAIFLVYILFALFAFSWLWLRQAETLAPERRRALTPHNLWSAFREVVGNREVRLYTAAMTLGYGQMFALLSSIQQIFDQTYDRGESFPLWFAGIAAVSATGSFINSAFVMRLGMRRIVILAYSGATLLSLLALGLLGTGLVSGDAGFLTFYVWGTSVFFIAGLTFGNLNALAVQKMGHIAGMATSIVTAISTILATLIAGPVGLAFDGTERPAIVAAVICSVLALGLMTRSEKF